MPELPEVETVRRGLAPVLEGKRIRKVHLGRPDLRFPFSERFAERLVGRRFTGLDRRAKYLLGTLDDGTALLMHLGMSGSFRVEDDEALLAAAAFHHARSKDRAHDHVLFDVEGARVIYNDPRRFGFMLLTDQASLASHPLLRSLGAEPIGNAFDADYLAKALQGRRTSLKAALLDQTVVAGLGNIYACEALWRAGLSPFGTAGQLSSEAVSRLAAHIRAVIGEAIEKGGSSLRDHVRTDGSLGYFQHHFSVYDRQGQACLRPGCGGGVERRVQNGRATFFCGACQEDDQSASR